MKSFISKSFAYLLCLALIISAFSAMAVSADANYGTVEDGITSDSNNMVQDLLPVDTLMNGDFSNGLMYWGTNLLSGGKASDSATVTDGIVSITGGLNAGIMSVPVNLPAEAVGKNICSIFEGTSTGSMQVKLVTSSSQSAYAGTIGSTWSFKSTTSVVAGETAYIQIQIDAAGVIAQVDNIRLAYFNGNNTYTTFDGVLINSSGNAYYGTVADGITNDAANKTRLLTPTNTFMNGDFSSGLMYWGLDSNVLGNASLNTTVTNGAAVITGLKYSNIRSVLINLPAEAVGKNICAIFNGASTGMAQVKLTTGSLSGSYNGTIGSTMIFKSTTAVTASTTAYVYIQNGADGVTVTVDDIRIVYNNGDGTFTTFDGVRLNSSGNAYYGTVADGITNDAVNKTRLLAATAGFMNGDFSSGLMYWGLDSNALGKASLNATVTDGVASITGAQYANIRSVSFNLPAEAVGKSICAIFDGTSTGSMSVRLYTGSVIGAYAGTLGSTKITKRTTSVTASATAYIYMQIDTAGVIGNVDNIKLAYDNGDTTYTTFDGVLLNSSGNAYYGTANDGITNDSTNQTRLLTPTAKFMNGDFSSGLMYWGLADNILGKASVNATVTDGVVTITGAQYAKIRTVQVNLPAEVVGKNICVAFEGTSTGTVQVKLTTGSATGTYFGTLGSIWSSKRTTMVTAGATAYVLIQVDNAVDTACFDNIHISFIDVGGLDLPSDIDGTPIKYSYGDANADGAANIKDLVRMKKYEADNVNVKIYFAAAKLDKVSSGFGIADIIIMKKYLIGAATLG